VSSVSTEYFFFLEHTQYSVCPRALKDYLQLALASKTETAQLVFLAEIFLRGFCYRQCHIARILLPPGSCRQRDTYSGTTNSIRAAATS